MIMKKNSNWLQIWNKILPEIPPNPNPETRGIGFSLPNPRGMTNCHSSIPRIPEEWKSLGNWHPYNDHSLRKDEHCSLNNLTKVYIKRVVPIKSQTEAYWFSGSFRVYPLINFQERCQPPCFFTYTNEKNSIQPLLIEPTCVLNQKKNFRCPVH